MFIRTCCWQGPARASMQVHSQEEPHGTLSGDQLSILTLEVLSRLRMATISCARGLQFWQVLVRFEQEGISDIASFCKRVEVCMITTTRRAVADGRECLFSR